MKIVVEFDSMEEFEAFRGGESAEGNGKTPRSRKKGDKGEAAGASAQTPDLAQPPANGAAPQMATPTLPQGTNGVVTGFPGAAAPAGAGFPGAAPATGGLPAVDPAVTEIVGRINARVDGALAQGQPAQAVLDWFRQQCGPDAANATLDQIKTVFLPKLQLAQLGEIAKLMNA